MVVHCAGECSPEEKTRLFEILNKPRDDTTKEDVLWVKELFEKHGSIGYSRSTAEKFLSESKGVISGLPEELRSLLEGFAEYMVKRER